MLKITKISIKQNDGTFSTPYEIGAKAENVNFNDGINLENKIKNLQKEVDKKAIKNHASLSKDYGLGTEDMYGHLKITDKYDKLGKDPQQTAISQQGIKDLLDSLNKYLKSFVVLDGDKLFSSFNTAYLLDQRRMRLVSESFEIRENENDEGNQILIIN